jgi:hypothetical protein
MLACIESNVAIKGGVCPAGGDVMLLAVDPEPPPQAAIIKSGSPPIHRACRSTEDLATIERTPQEEALALVPTPLVSASDGPSGFLIHRRQMTIWW